MCVLLGVELGAVVAGFANLGAGAAVALLVIGLTLAPWTGMAGFFVLHLGLRRRRGLHGPPVLRTAVAKIESVREIREGEEVLLQLDLTVAPEDGPAFRAEAGVDVHLSRVDQYRTGRTVAVDYEAARSWRVVLRRDPDPDQAARIAAARIDTAPAETRRVPPPRERVGTGRYGAAAVAAGLLVSLWPLWALCGGL
ncbi:hypothetical protein ACFW1A_36565 [Kitasatospora sp. NPDC058965]|uniref:hypothetical protein n=1 Tax=Kitasatospora sp. NPDC058965 TaxID=3346682 RepID=UPI00367D0ABE